MFAYNITQYFASIDYCPSKANLLFQKGQFSKKSYWIIIFICSANMSAKEKGKEKLPILKLENTSRLDLHRNSIGHMYLKGFKLSFKEFEILLISYY